MSPPNKIFLPGVYDEVEGVCRLIPEEAQVCTADPEPAALGGEVSSLATVSRSQLLNDAFGASRRVNPLWSESPYQYSLLAIPSLLTGCGAPSEPPPPGDPISSASPLGPESAMNAAPLAGNLDGVDLTGAGARNAVAWSVFDSTTPANTGTFAFLRNGGTGGSVSTVSNEATARHLTTSAAMLDNGETVVVYTRTDGDPGTARIVARRLSASGSPIGGDITLVGAADRANVPDAQVVSTGDGFVAVYRDGNGQLVATSFNADGTQAGSLNLGSEPTSRSHYAVARGEGDTWVLAEISGSNQVHVRSFHGVTPGDVDENIGTSGFSSTASLSVAMNEEGSIMTAWNAQGGGIFGAVLGGPSDQSPFRITSSGLANTMSIANDHRGNFLFAWEQGGQVLARVYNGTSSFTTPADFSVIASGNTNSNVQAHVSDDGVFSISWIRSGNSGGSTVQDLMRRDYRLNYE
ncbi:MAG: hypothetical protein IT573_10730 [Deltaproteobacteria bacterium]|nr:hypothetical protein [Deltaproteobacteria bacterium]